MGEEDAAAGEEEEEESSASDWELGLPSAEDLTPLSQFLVPPELAFAFNISPEPHRTSLDLHRASHSTFSSLLRSQSVPKSLPPFASDDPTVIEPSKPQPPMPAPAPTPSIADEADARAAKRSRLVWTPQLQKRFIDVVAHLGVKNAVPKTIMQLMNVEGLTRENVASHLQKYRLYLKRMRGSSDEGPSSSPDDQEPPASMAVQYALPAMIPMFGMHHHGHGNPVESLPCRGFESHQSFGDNQGGWPGGNKFGSIVSYPRAMPSDK